MAALMTAYPIETMMFGGIMLLVVIAYLGHKTPPDPDEPIDPF